MFLVHHLDFACVIGILTPLVSSALRLCETDNDQKMLAQEEGITTSKLLVPLDRTVRNAEIHKVFLLNWKIFTVRRDGSIGTNLLPLTLMGI